MTRPTKSDEWVIFEKLSVLSCKNLKNLKIDGHMFKKKGLK